MVETPNQSCVVETQNNTTPKTTKKVVLKKKAHKRVKKVDESLIQIKPKRRTRAEIEADLIPQNYCKTCRFCHDNRCSRVNNRPVIPDYHRCKNHSDDLIKLVISMDIANKVANVEIGTIEKVS